jgi:hypothetical protein
MVVYLPLLIVVRIEDTFKFFPVRLMGYPELSPKVGNLFVTPTVLQVVKEIGDCALGFPSQIGSFLPQAWLFFVLIPQPALQFLSPTSSRLRHHD